ncbi:MAG: hypothetical protein E8D48_01865 [Nitrospira sp.]|nr:MAG: hypothetical protein E8D48_01865 [Nitrospira sp.]
MADKTSPLLIDQVRDLPRKEHYTTVSVTQGFTEQLFNGVAGMTTRKIRICGVKLIWDEYENTNPTGNLDEVTTKLFNYSGSNDIESLEMYADEIVIRSPLVFPQADVWICARTLVFEGNGSITTTPLPYPPAYTTTRDNNGRPLNERGQIEAKSGLNGPRGGHIVLCLPEGANFIIPASDRPAPRFLTVGGKGQDAESGGYLDYVPKANQRKMPGDKTIGGFLKAWYVENIPKDEFSKGEGRYDASDWQWPDRWEDTFEKSYSVMHAKLDVNIDRIYHKTPKSSEKGERIWPGGVPDAFPSGKGGDGGAGGMFRTFWMTGVAVAGRQTPESTALYAKTEGGEHGTSAEIPARRPEITTDSSRPPVFVHMKLAHRAGAVFSEKPSLNLEHCPFPIVAGKGAAARNGQKGQPGSRKSFWLEVSPYPVETTSEQRKQLLDRYPNGWPNHLVVEPALQYARDAYLNGHRDAARELLERYRNVIEWVPEDARSAELAGLERAQHTLAESCATISKSLLQSAAIGRQMQTMGNALDLEVKLYARTLRQRSEERLRKSLYHVVKSYEYHTLNRVPPDFFQTDVIKKIVALEEAKLAAGQLDQTLTESDFSQIYDTVFKAKFSQLGQQITDGLQRVRPSMENRYLCTFKPAHLTQLTDTWRFSFKIVEDFEKTTGKLDSVIGARIVGIALKTLDIATTDRGLSLDVEFTHSGKHVIAAPGGFQYFFQIGKYPVEAQDGSGTKQWVNDQPIAWRMVYNAAAGSQAVTLDEQAKDDQIVQYLLREYKPGTESDAKMLQEHRPAFTSDITLTLDGGLDLNDTKDVSRKNKKSFKVRALEFWVFFKRQ